MRLTPRALALLLAGIQLLLLGRTAWDKSDTVDEPTYIGAAIHQWVRTFEGRPEAAFDRNCESPALPKWGMALGLRIAAPGLFEAWVNRGSRKEPDPLSPPLEHARVNLFAARSATILLTALAGLLLWSAARVFGDRAAFVAHALWCFSPTVLAQGSLATLDAWAADLCCASLWAALRFAHRPSGWRAALVGASVGLAAACKVPTLGVLPVFLVAAGWLLHGAGGGWLRRWLSAAAASLAGLVLVLWVVYGFTVASVKLDDLCGLGGGIGPGTLGPVPFPSWISGLLIQWVHGEGGHLSYLFGQAGSEGWWWFYLACLALKTTIGAQALALIGIAARIRRRPARADWLADAAILCYTLLLLVVLSLGKTQNGVRYILPAFPFAMLWAGRAAEAAMRAFGRRGVALVAAALLTGSVESLAVHPHHLMFFNRWVGGPTDGPRYLVHGDDWGQDQRNLAEFMRAQQPWRLYYTFYNGNPGRWGLAWEQAPCQPMPGYYALQAIEVHRPKRMDAGCLDWLTVEPPDARIGYSIYFYQVTKARIERLKKERWTETPFWRSGPVVPRAMQRVAP